MTIINQIGIIAKKIQEFKCSTVEDFTDLDILLHQIDSPLKDNHSKESGILDDLMLLESRSIGSISPSP